MRSDTELQGESRRTLALIVNLHLHLNFVSVFVLYSYWICIVFLPHLYHIHIFDSLLGFLPGTFSYLGREMLKRCIFISKRDRVGELERGGSQIGSRNHFGQIYSRTPANLVKRICPFGKRKKTPPIKNRAFLWLSNIWAGNSHSTHLESKLAPIIICGQWTQRICTSIGGNRWKKRC